MNDDRLAVRTTRLDFIREAEDDRPPLERLLVDIANPRQRSDVGMTIACRADDCRRQRQLGVREPVQFGGEKNVSDVPVAVHDVEGASDVEHACTVPDRGRENRRSARFYRPIERRRPR